MFSLLEYWELCRSGGTGYFMKLRSINMICRAGGAFNAAKIARRVIENNGT